MRVLPADVEAGGRGTRGCLSALCCRAAGRLVLWVPCANNAHPLLPFVRAREHARAARDASLSAVPSSVSRWRMAHLAEYPPSHDRRPSPQTAPPLTTPRSGYHSPQLGPVTQYLEYTVEIV